MCPIDAYIQPKEASTGNVAAIGNKSQLSFGMTKGIKAKLTISQKRTEFAQYQAVKV